MGKTLEECYEVLGLDLNATEAEIKSAYRQKALKCHPDKNPDDPSSTQKFQELGHAYRRLMGEEDSDEEDDWGDDDDMDLWRDFFFFLFRDEILARVQCRCSRCGRGDEDDDFLASLIKEQEERYQFTEEEMAQFTSFASLKEQREANKQKFCNKKISSSKPEQKSNKGQKTKLKSNKQLKREQWKKQKEISEIAAQINQNPKLQEKKASNRKHHTDKSPSQRIAIETGCAKEQTDHVAYNKRNTRKKRNRQKSKKQETQETDSNQDSGSRSTTSFQQKVSSSSVVQEGIRKVNIKPETTKRQDDVTPAHHANYYARQRMKQSGSHRNVSQVSDRGWPETSRPLTTDSKPAYGSNIWQKRQEKQQLLAELQPANQTDEEMQLQIALELSRKQAEIDAQQREISILEKQMEETLQIGKSVKLETAGSDGFSMRYSSTEPTEGVIDIDPEGFPPIRDSLENEQECGVVDPLEIEERCGEEEWVVASGSEEEWGYTDKEDDELEESVAMRDDRDLGYSNCGNGQVEEAKGYQTTYSDPFEKHQRRCSASNCGVSGKNNVTLDSPDMQLSGCSGKEGSQASDCCPYGMNCCLGKRCKYSHPVSGNKWKRQKSFDDRFDSQDKRGTTRIEEKSDDISNGHNFKEKHDVSLSVSSEELPLSVYSDDSYTVISNGHSLSTSKSYLGDSVTKDCMESIKTEASSVQLLTNFTQSVKGTAKRENVNRPLTCNMLGVESYGNGPMPTKKKPKTRSAVNDGGGGAVESVHEKGATVSHVHGGDSPSPTTSSRPSVSKQPATTMPHVHNLADAKVQDPAYRTTQPINYVKPLPSSAPAVFAAPASHSTRQSDIISGTTQEPSQNTAVPSAGGNTSQTSGTSHQPSTDKSRPLTQPLAMNNIPPMPGFPLFPLGNLPFFNTGNVSSFNQSLLAMASLGRIPLPIIPGPSNGVLTPQETGSVMSPEMPSLYSKKTFNGCGTSTQRSVPPTAPVNGYSGGAPGLENASSIGPDPLQSSQAGRLISSQALSQVNGFPGFPFAATMQGAGYPVQLSQPGPTDSSQSTVQAMLQNGSVGMPLGTPMSGTAAQASQSVTSTNPLSSTDSMPRLQVNPFTGMPNIFGTALTQAGVTAIPQSSALDISQLLRSPLPLFNPQVLVNLNAQMASLGTPFSNPSNGCQTTVPLQPRMDTSQVQNNGEDTKVNTVKPLGSEAQKEAELKLEGEEAKAKAPSLRRPTTVPKVIQHQALK